MLPIERFKSVSVTDAFRCAEGFVNVIFYIWP